MLDLHCLCIFFFAMVPMSVSGNGISLWHGSGGYFSRFCRYVIVSYPRVFRFPQVIVNIDAYVM